MRLAASVLALALTSTALVTSARAAEPEVALGQEAPEIRTHRTFGFGLGLGVGGQLFLGGRGLRAGGAVLLPAIELQLFPFRRRDWSIDFSLPLWNTIINAAVFAATFLSLDAYVDFNVGKGNTRLVVGPGLGLAYRDNGTGFTGGVRIPFQIGAELLSAKKHIGVRLLVRSWTELIVPTRNGGIDTGLLAVLVVTGYTTRVSLSDAEP